MHQRRAPVVLAGYLTTGHLMSVAFHEQGGRRRCASQPSWRITRCRTGCPARRSLSMGELAGEHGDEVEWTEITWNPATGCNHGTGGRLRRRREAPGLATIQGNRDTLPTDKMAIASTTVH
jgi:hypothetical protein